MLRKGLCGGQDEANCAAEFGDGLAWACRRCPRKRAGDLNPYTLKLLRCWQLQEAGYPIAANDLTLDEWMDLGIVRRMLAAPAKTK